MGLAAVDAIMIAPRMMHSDNQIAGWIGHPANAIGQALGTEGPSDPPAVELPSA